MTPEHKFQNKILRPALDKIPGCYFFVKEAASIRGLPDIVGLVNGNFFALEVKRSLKEAGKRTGRIVLQRLVLSKIRGVGGYACFVYPENLSEVLQDIRELANPLKD